MSKNQFAEDFLAKHDVKRQLEIAVNAAIKANPDDALKFIANNLASAGEEKMTSSAAHFIPYGPVAYLTSTGFVTEGQWTRFVKIVLKRRGVLELEDEKASVTRAELVKKYEKFIKKLKVTYINDASYHRPTENMAAGRVGDGKVAENLKLDEDGHCVEGYIGRGPGTWFWWDQGLEDLMGIPPENINMIQLLEKPWLFNRPLRDANMKEATPNVAELDPADQEEYYAALKLTQDAYDAHKEKEPQVGAGQVGGSLPGCPASGLSCADELAAISAKLNDKYADALDKWCKENIDTADIIVGQGGEVVMLNMAWQCNQKVASRLVDAVRNNKCVYAGLSASTMVAAKSMEMTGEIQPGWIEAFAADAKYLTRSSHFDMKDLNADGVNLNVLGALPLLEAPIAMRPHYSASWEAQVLAKNLLAEKEFEEETGILVDDSLVRSSNKGCEVGCELLTLISKHGSKQQDRPVFVPVRNGKVIEVNIYTSGAKVTEHFHVID